MEKFFAMAIYSSVITLTNALAQNFYSKVHLVILIGVSLRDM